MKQRCRVKRPFLGNRAKAEKLGLDMDELEILQLIARGDDGQSVMARFRLTRSSFVLAVLRIQLRTGTQSIREMEKFARAAGV